MEMEYKEESILVENKYDKKKEELKKFRQKKNKSKYSCSACKERKIKCDQKTPICSFCEKKGIECPYLFMTPFQIHRIEKLRKSKIQTKINNTDVKKYNENETREVDSNIYIESGSINSNTVESTESEYQIHEIENSALPSSINYTLMNSNSKPLYNNSRKSNRTFNTSHDISIFALEESNQNYELLVSLLTIKNLKNLKTIIKEKKLESASFYNYINTLTISQLFNTLVRKSFLLFATDYYKNIILKQQILPKINYMRKLSVSCKCEIDSAILIDQVSKIIKNDYLPNFKNFAIAFKNITLGCCIILDDCLGYHFKNGLKYDMSFEDGEKSIELVGVFSTGIYSIIMEKYNENFLMSNKNVLSSYLITSFRELMTNNYNLNLFSDFKIIIDRLSTFYHNDVNYENLKLFCEKHEILLINNLENDSLLGFNNSYLIRFVNSYHSILPFDNVNMNQPDFELSDLDILIRIAYFLLAQIIRCLIPGIKNITAGFFSGSDIGIFNYSNIGNLMKFFNKIKDKNLKIIAIYLIRTGLFLKARLSYYRNYLLTFKLDLILTNDTDLSIHQRYLNLKRFKYNGFISEIQIKSFLLEKGQFIKDWNRPNIYRWKPNRGYKVSENKISNYFNNNQDLMIEDFARNNNGFFSLDFNILKEQDLSSSFVNVINNIDNDQMKMLWKLITYIRINNL